MLAPIETLSQFSSQYVHQWHDVCALTDLLPGSGMAALVLDQQIALIRPELSDRVYALSNFDPFSKAFVIARGIIGDKGGTLKIASPVYKQTFELETGRCIEEPDVQLETFPVRVVDGRIAVGMLVRGEHTCHE